MSTLKGSGPALRTVPLPQLTCAVSASSASTSAVADDIAVLARADAELAVALDQIAASRTPVCTATVRRLEQLLAVVRHGASVRVRLQHVDPDVLRAGCDLWLARRELDPVERNVHVAG